MTLEEMELEQSKLASLIRYDCHIDIRNIHTVAGVDIIYKGDKATCCIVVCEYPSGRVLEIKSGSMEVSVPYIPGKFGFREVPPFIHTLTKIVTNADVYMFDGNGVLHERGLGLAAHASLYVRVPCIGVAKTRYNYDSFAYKVGNSIYRKGDNVEIGREVITRNGCNPLYVSIGNRLSLDEAEAIVRRLVDSKTSRQPIPLRLADLETHTYK